MGTANEDYLDAALRDAVGLRRYSLGLTRRVARLLEEADAELIGKLKVRLSRLEGKPLDFTGERWTALLAEVREARSEALGEYRTLTRTEVGKLGTVEAAREMTALSESIPILIEFTAVASDQLRAIVSSRPFQGRLLKDWFSTLEKADAARVVQALQLGMTLGEPTDAIVRRLRGTRAKGYSDGALSITRRDAMTIARTAVNHVSNTAREYVAEANSDVIKARVWHSTLDGRTSAVCRARDGHGVPIGDAELPPSIPLLKPPGVRPPAHMNCRSVMVAYIDGDALLGTRPTVTDTRTRERREIDFRAQARESGRDIRDIRKEWAGKNIGRTPASTTYGEFLKRQSPEFQDDVLGKTKGRLFRTGKVRIDEYVDRAGNELTLKQLAAKNPAAFAAAGLDPTSFGD